MLRVIVLICAMSSGPCNEQTAVDVMRLPETYAVPTACLLEGERYVAAPIDQRRVREVQDGRALREGSMSAGKKLTPEQQREIKRRFDAGRSVEEIAEALDITPKTVYAVNRRLRESTH